jgi:hypothetical protein
VNPLLKGIYKIHIRHAVRQTGKVDGVERLKGISDIGFRIETRIRVWLKK